MNFGRRFGLYQEAQREKKELIQRQSEHGSSQPGSLAEFVLISENLVSNMSPTGH